MPINKPEFLSFWCPGGFGILRLQFNLVKKSKEKYKFIDLFAGIGGTRLGFERAGGVCVFTSEWDKFSQISYKENFSHLPDGDITKIDAQEIPDHDILLAGFPCQPFSLAGVSKKISLGRKHGFDDEKQGNLFFDIARILITKKPQAFMLENVKNLKSHDGGKTFAVIISTLESLGYSVRHTVIDAKKFVPQHRERTYIVGFRNELYPDISFEFPNVIDKSPRIKDILDKKIPEKYTLSDKLWNYLQQYAQKHKANGNGFGFGLIDPVKDISTRTLSARYHKDGSEILIKQKNKNPRRLTPRECARLMGFPETYKIVVSDTQAYRQFGNSIVVPVVETIANQMFNYMNNYGQNLITPKKSQHVRDTVKSK